MIYGWRIVLKTSEEDSELSLRLIKFRLWVWHILGVFMYQAFTPLVRKGQDCCCCMCDGMHAYFNSDLSNILFQRNGRVTAAVILRESSYPHTSWVVRPSHCQAPKKKESGPYQRSERSDYLEIRVFGVKHTKTLIIPKEIHEVNVQ